MQFMKDQDRIKQTWYTADLHLGHTNILRPEFDGRPFKDINHHDESIIANLHEVIKPWDDVYYLGDIAFRKDKDELDILVGRLPGNKYFIKGNHDHRDIRKLFAKHGEYLGEQATVKITYELGTQLIVLNHFPMRSWHNSHHGTSWHLYGHHHGDLAPFEHGKWGKSMDVGINTNKYYPYNTLQIHSYIAHIPPKDLMGDHHKSKAVA